MERVLSDEEKLRKAEEIYLRRKSTNVTVPSGDLNRNVQKKDKKRFKKMLIQIGVSVLIYIVIYVIQNSNLFFSSEFIKKVELVLAYDINFSEKISQLNDYIKNNNFLKRIISCTCARK